MCGDVYSLLVLLCRIFVGILLFITVIFGLFTAGVGLGQVHTYVCVPAYSVYLVV